VLDPQGRVTSWSVTATELFGAAACEETGRHVCDVLLTGEGHRQLMEAALAEAAAGRVFGATVAGGGLGERRFTIRCEPLWPGANVLMIVQAARPHPARNWLTEAASRIGSTLDLATTAAEVVGVAVPAFADLAVIYGTELLFTAGEVVAAGRPPSARGQGSRSEPIKYSGQRAVVRRLAASQAGRDAVVTDGLLSRDEVLVLGEGTPAARAMATGEPVLFDRLDEESVERIRHRPGFREFVAGYNSFLALPLIARGDVVGCMLFGRVPASPGFSPGEIVLASELASRAAVCIDNARLYHRERRTAQALQRGLLPARPRAPAGMEVAQCHLPVGASVVGGDWHDVVQLPGGSAAFIVGDAMGHGPEAAAVMAQLRTAAHTLAELGMPPQEVLRRVDKIAASMPTALFATCIYTVIDPVASSCVAARAGHLPPVLVLPDGSTTDLTLPAGLPLGLGDESFEAATVSLPPGATLALYTDGLVESRARPLDDGIAALRAALGSALASPQAPLQAACWSVTEALSKHGEDDITLVLARIRQ
jgi:GAF domain-containing protein